jgi:hypothetical protein
MNIKVKKLTDTTGNIEKQAVLGQIKGYIFSQ